MPNLFVLFLRSSTRHPEDSGLATTTAHAVCPILWGQDPHVSVMIAPFNERQDILCFPKWQCQLLAAQHGFWALECKDWRAPIHAGFEY